MTNRSMPREASPTQISPRLQGDLAQIDALWRVTNYVSVGQIYLLDLIVACVRRSHERTAAGTVGRHLARRGQHLTRSGP